LKEGKEKKSGKRLSRSNKITYFCSKRRRMARGGEIESPRGTYNAKMGVGPESTKRRGTRRPLAFTTSLLLKKREGARGCLRQEVWAIRKGTGCKAKAFKIFC